MAKFSVVVIREKREKDYYDFWKHNVNINASGKKLGADLVGFTEIIEAKNRHEAESLIQQKYPRLTIDVEATQRHP